MSNPKLTYRDATYSAETQAKLRQLRRWLDMPRGARGEALPSEVAALDDVIERWDANEATEEVFDAPLDAA